jgi:ubiquinone/menaquinone biosynthesis C-methylase UbiE
MASSIAHADPNPALIWDNINAYQRTACLKGAVELGLFTRIGEGAQTVEEIAAKCAASVRGVRILCDYLTIVGLLTKTESRYGLMVDSAAFLDQRSPAYLGGTLTFLNNSTLTGGFQNVAEVVRRGTTMLDGSGTVDPDDPVWVEFAKTMPPIVAPAAQFIAEVAATSGPQKVLDIAAGHGLFGISIARRNPQAEISPVDWSAVLDVAKENAAAAGVSDRYRPIVGDAFQADFGTGYDVALLTNFLHHFDRPTNETLLRKVRASLAPGGKVYTLEFVPNEDRISPPAAAAFAVIMLASTPSGDAYTFEDLKAMFAAAGFSKTERMDVPRSPETLVVSS